jgi:hypothetical protein
MAQAPGSDMETVCKLLGIEEFLPETRLVILLNAEVYAIFTLAARLFYETQRLKSRLERSEGLSGTVGGHGPGYD